jgi:hypothetical protein
MSPEIQSLIVTVVLAVVGAVFAPLLAMLVKELHALFAAKVKNERLRGVLDRLDDAAGVVVASVEQTVVSKLDPKQPLGANGRAARDAAIAELKTHLGARGIDEAKEVLGIGDSDLEKILVSYIESKVGK